MFCFFSFFDLNYVESAFIVKTLHNVVYTIVYCTSMSFIGLCFDTIGVCLHFKSAWYVSTEHFLLHTEFLSVWFLFVSLCSVFFFSFILYKIDFDFKRLDAFKLLSLKLSYLTFPPRHFCRLLYSSCLSAFVCVWSEREVGIFSVLTPFGVYLFITVKKNQGRFVYCSPSDTQTLFLFVDS